MIKSLFSIIIAIGLAAPSVASSLESLDCAAHQKAPTKKTDADDDKDKQPEEQSNSDAEGLLSLDCAAHAPKAPTKKADADEVNDKNTEQSNSLDEDGDDGDEKLATSLLPAPKKEWAFPTICHCIKAPCNCAEHPKIGNALDNGDSTVATSIIRAPTKFEKMYFPPTCQCIKAPCHCNGHPKTKPDRPREEMEE